MSYLRKMNMQLASKMRFVSAQLEKKAGQNVSWKVFDVSGNVIGYARVSARGQSLDSRVDALVSGGAVCFRNTLLGQSRHGRGGMNAWITCSRATS